MQRLILLVSGIMAIILKISNQANFIQIIYIELRHMSFQKEKKLQIFKDIYCLVKFDEAKVLKNAKKNKPI